ncbi:MAG: isoleucine--tRNA ligase [Actinomycetota bacterium]
MPFAPVDRALDLPALETAALERWERDDTFAESLRRRAGSPAWVFYEGPPTANGRPGIHHVWARLFKDLYPRFHTMRGRYVARKGGWDCHGLPVEVEVEKELGFSGKQQIEAYGIEAFNAKCRESVQRYVGDFESLTRRIGMWLDIDDAYWTMSNEFIESVWWLFAEMWAKGDIEEGFKVVPYCGRCGTALSSHELGQPGAYRDVVEDSVYVRFPVVDHDFDLLVWTTTPWTLPSNTAVAVGPDLAYVRVSRPRPGEEARDVVMAATRVAAVLGSDAEVVGPVDAASLVGLRYHPPFDLLQPDPATGDAYRVVADEFVTADDGSGLVHLAPAFGEVDREVAAREGIGVLNPVGPDGAFTGALPAPYAGRFVKDADPDLIAALAASGRLEACAPYEHSYPHCWRCGTALIYWAKPTWFARTARHRDDLLRENAQIGWHPGHIKDGRFGDWLANNVDWALSRDRFWGTPIPVWRCGDCGHDACAGSLAELSELAGRPLDGLDLHRPFVDDIVVRCPDCGGEARRVEPVLDAWFDSGSMPAAQLHYPFSGEDALEGRFPADFICEAIDQTRGWFYSLLAVNTLVFGRSPYRNVVCLAHVVDQDGQKMSKSKGNVIDPWTVLDSRGADALRWYFFSAGSPWTPRRVFVDGIDESTRRFLLTVGNTYSFFVTYANLDGWTPPEPGTAVAPSGHVLDRWIRSRVHATVAEVTEALEAFDALRGAQALERLVDDLSNWYVRRSRPRFWKAADPAAHATLHEALTTTVTLLAPFCPFVADEIWSNLVPGAGSVHLADWPAIDTGATDPALEAEMAAARQVVTLGRAARTEAKVKVRQPLPRALVLVPGATWSSEVLHEIPDELNVKSIEPVQDLEGLLDYTVVPNFRALGPRLGPLVPAVREALAAADGAGVRRAFERAGEYHIEIDGNEVVVGPDDVEIRAAAHEELAVVQDGPVAVALDTTIDDDLRLEGLARELVRALNDLRKERDLALADRILVTVRATGAVLDAARRHGDWIAGEVLAVDWTTEDAAPIATDARLTVEGVAVGVGLVVAGA